MNRRKQNWNDNESRVFLKSWKDHVHLYRLKSYPYCKTPLYDAICKDLHKNGHKRSLTEIMHKIKNIRRRNLMVPGASHFRWFQEVKEILRMEKTEHDLRQASEPQMKQASKLFYGPHVEGNVPGSIEVVTTNDPNDENDSDSDLLPHTAIKNSEPEALNNIQRSLPKLSSSHSKKSTETILLNICREFQSTNRELEANDVEILELFKKQNAIFKKQTRLLMKLL